MTEQIEIRGIWWLPDNEDKKIAGIVNYIPTESIKLELIGSFYDDDLAMFNSDRRQPIIWGESSDGKDITLIDCFSSLSWHSNCSFSLLKFSVCYVIIGKHIDSLEEMVFTKATVQFDELSLWYCPSIISYFLKDNQTWDRITNNYDDNFAITTKVDTVSITLQPKALLNTERQRVRMIVEQRTDFIIKPDDKISIQEVLNINGQFEQFLSIATLSQVQCKNISLCEEENSSKIILLHNFFRKEYSPKLNGEYYLFDYKILEDNYQKVITKWFQEPKDIYQIRSHLISSIGNTHVFSSANFLAVVQAIEGYYCRFIEDNKKLNIILRNLCSEFNSINKVDFGDDAINEIVDSRNHYSHLLPIGKKENVVDGRELLQHFKKLRILLLCCILKFMGLDNDKIKQIINNCRNAICR